MKGFNLTASNTSGLYEALSKLTLNRSGNRGTLAVGMNGDGSITLSCVNHKLLGGNNYKVTADNANELRDIVFCAVSKELTDTYQKMVDAVSDAQEKKAVEAKFHKVMEELQKMIYQPEGGEHKIGFTRKDIESVLLNVNALKDTLDIDCLMKMEAQDLAHLAEGGNRAQANQVKSESRTTAGWNGMFKRKVDELGAGQALEAFKPQLSAAVSRDKNLVSERKKTVEGLLQFKPSAGGGFQGGTVALLTRTIEKLIDDDFHAEGFRMSDQVRDGFKAFLEKAKEYNDPKADKQNVSFVNEAFESLANYKSELDQQLAARIATCNASLEAHGIKALHIDNDGTVAVRNDVEGQRDELIQEDLKKLADIIASPVASEARAAIGLDFGSDGIVSKLVALSAADDAVGKKGNFLEMQEIGAEFRFGHEAIPDDHDDRNLLKERFLKGEFKTVLAEQCQGKDLKAHVSFAANFFARMSLLLKESSQKTNGIAKAEYASLYNKFREFAQGCNTTSGKDFLEQWKNERNQNWDLTRLDDAVGIEMGTREDKSAEREVEFRLQQEKLAIYGELNRILEVAVACYDEAKA